MRREIYYIILTISLTLAYAVLRYHIFKGVEWDHFPLYISNKAIAWTALILLGVSLTLRGRTSLAVRRICGLYGFYLGTLHALISFIVLRPNYFPKLFNEGQLTLLAESSMLAGIIGFTFMMRYQFMRLEPSAKNIPANAKRNIGVALIAFTFLHTTLLGWKGWWDVSAWPGYLPPITILSSITALVFLFIAYREWNDEQS